jgi:hypothetical protein
MQGMIILLAVVAVLHDAVADLPPCSVAKLAAPFVVDIILDATSTQMPASLALIGDFLAHGVACSRCAL